MTELELFKFTKDHNIENHWYIFNDENGDIDREEIIYFLYFYQLEDFMKLIKGMDTDEPLSCKLMDGYIGLDIMPVCEYYNIKPENVFEVEQIF
jgi:hypothetical protein